MRSKEIMLVCDNASYHSSSKTKELYIKNKIERIECLARPPDLNSIENI